MSNDNDSPMVEEQAASAATGISSPATAPTPSSEPQSGHERSSLVMPKDTKNTVMPLAMPPQSHHNIQYQPSKPSSPPPLRPIRSLDPAIAARLKEFSMSRKDAKSIPRPSQFSNEFGLSAERALHPRRNEESAALKEELDEPEVKAIATAGLTNDQWRATKGLLVVKGDVERPTAK